MRAIPSGWPTHDAVFVTQAAVDKFAAEFEGLLQSLEADPEADLPGYGQPVPLSCVRLCSLR